MNNNLPKMEKFKYCRSAGKHLDPETGRVIYNYYIRVSPKVTIAKSLTLDKGSYYYETQLKSLLEAGYTIEQDFRKSVKLTK